MIMKLKIIQNIVLEYFQIFHDNVKKSIYFNHVENKHCIVCANRIADRDFKIPEGIVCGHPSNQNGKDRFCHYCHTCEHWKRETKLR